MLRHSGAALKESFAGTYHIPAKTLFVIALQVSTKITKQLIFGHVLDPFHCLFFGPLAVSDSPNRPRGMQMRICQVVAGFGEGGLEKHVRELTQQLLDAGHDVKVFGDRRFLSTLPTRTTTVPVRFHLNRHNPLLLLELLTKLRACDCDVIHAQANKAANMISLLKRWLPCATLGTLHNIKRNVQAFHKLDHVIAVSKQLAQCFPSDEVSIIYNGIDTPKLTPIDLRAIYALPAGLPVLCAVGRLVHAKGFDVLLEAIDGLPVSLLIAGDGAERAALQQRLDTLSPITQVRLLGHQANAMTLMSSADGVVIASRREGFSYVCIEALLSGTRILSTDVPVANEILPADLIVPADDSVALRAKLVALLNDTTHWDSQMLAPRRQAQSSMSLAHMRDQTLAVYSRLKHSRLSTGTRISRTCGDAPEILTESQSLGQPQVRGDV